MNVQSPHLQIWVLHPEEVIPIRRGKSEISKNATTLILYLQSAVLRRPCVGEITIYLATSHPDKSCGKRGQRRERTDANPAPATAHGARIELRQIVLNQGVALAATAPPVNEYMTDCSTRH
ncbi:hypothetical protein EVAR_59301_1 [Eumeta japonica]|uniref:Uncharacterized protein n=1 Tax=Eumeta variegata TaxID=151549 RepID=A0A4C1YDF0_EUMVA|nr:hypothetical protein EVAR_59301_1 [Eumeta japonica]